MRSKLLFTLAGFALGAICIMLLRPAGAVRPPAPERVTEAELALDRPVGEVDFEDTPLEQALATLAQKSGTPIVVDWTYLEPRGLERTQPVTLHARGIPLGEALDRILQPLDTFPDGSVTYSAETGKVAVGTVERVAARPIVRIYDVRDLLGPETPPDPQPPAIPSAATAPASGTGGGGFGGGGGGGGLFTIGPPAGVPPAPAAAAGGLFSPVPPRTTYEHRSQALRNLLENTVAPGTWRSGFRSPGTSPSGSIGEFGGRLVVVQSWPAQRQVRAMLRLIRNTAPPDSPAAAPATKLWRPELQQWVSEDPAPAEAGLLRVIPELRLDGVSFDDAVTVLGELAGVPISVRREALLKKGHADVPVQLRVKDVPVYRALELLLRTQEPGFPSSDGPDYGVKGGMIVVSTQEDTQSMTITRAYNLRHWLWRDLFANEPDGTHEGAQQNLARLITENVAPDTWRDNGGSSGTLLFFDDVMVVTQTWQNQERLRQFLPGLSADGSNLPATRPAAAPPARAPAQEVGVGVYPADRDVDARLRQVLPLVRMKGTPLAEAIDRLREQTGPNLFVDWGRLREINVDRETPVEIDLLDVSFARALHYLLASVGGPAGRADWGLDDEIIVVSTADAAQGMTLVRVYDVRDLIGPRTAAPPGPKTREDPVERLVRMLASDVDTDSWKDNGGPTGSIYELNGRLVIQQTWENHQQIAAILDSLRGRPLPGPRTAQASPTTRPQGVAP